MEKPAQAQPTVQATSTTTPTWKAMAVAFALASLLAMINFMVCFAAFKSAVELTVEPNTHLVVDRAGAVVEHHAGLRAATGKEFSAATFADLKQVKVFFPSSSGSGFGSYDVHSRELIPCPVAESDYCLHEHMYVLYTSNGEVIYGAEGLGEYEPVVWKFLDDTEFLKNAKKLAMTPGISQEHRHLSFIQTDFKHDATDCPAACTNSETGQDKCCRGCQLIHTFAGDVVVNGGAACGRGKTVDDCSYNHGCMWGYY